MVSRSLPTIIVRFLLAGSFCAAVTALFAGAAYAGNLEIQPSIEQDVSAESNPLMLINNSKGWLVGETTIPKITFTENTPLTQFSADAQINENIFNQSVFNSTDFHGDVNVDQKIEQWEAGMSAKTDYDTTRTSEITTFNTNTVGSVRHYGNSVSPDIAFNPTAVDKLMLLGTAQDSRYDSALFSNYEIFAAGPSWQHGFTPLDTGILSVQAQRYETTSGPNETIDDWGPTISWTRILSQQLTAKASLGALATRDQGAIFTGGNADTWKWNAIYSADLNYKGESDILDLNATKALEPYANGTEFYLSTITLSENHTLNSLFSANASVNYLYSSETDASTVNLKNQWGASAGFTYHATEKCDLTASYQYREESFTDLTQNANDNLFLVSFVYRPKLSNVTW